MKFLEKGFGRLKAENNELLLQVVLSQNPIPYQGSEIFPSSSNSFTSTLQSMRAMKP